ncbi:sulfite exporter TauE/SafE family protein [Corynebacterium sp.]|uniref:sulfite exporter TauE/SafE family protein n=1 Tax=Corynebacterium sp. TaxID=1720 RepID=UPI0025C15F38|nr:sulfite exporter TauE/SafE family protein [Corynebacterium sp.]
MELVLLVFVTILVGSCMQRVSGMGVGLIGGPVLSIAIGPVEGIMVVNVLAAVNAAMSTVTVRRDVDWGRFALIGSVMVVGAVPGAWLIHVIPPAVLQIVVGAVLLTALGVTSFGRRFIPEVSGKLPAVAAGVLGGFSNTLAGVAGPVITVYAQASRWDQRTFAATLQPLFIVSGVVSFAIKYLTDAGDISSEPWGIWPAAVVAMVIGISAGMVVSRRIERDRARRLAVAMAALGGVTVLVRGILSLG